MFWTVIILFFIALVYIFFRKLSSEDERIKTFLRIYKAAKNKFPDLEERQILGLVIEEHILPNKNIRLRNSGMKGIDFNQFKEP